MAYDLDALELQEFDPVCPTCRAPWAGIERLLANRRALQEEITNYRTIAENHHERALAAEAEVRALRAVEIAARKLLDWSDPQPELKTALDALDAARKP